MRELVAVTLLTVDGVMQGPGGAGEDRAGGVAHGGGVVPHVDAQLGAHRVGLVRRAGALLLGRKTSDSFAAGWPHAPETGPIAAVPNRIPKSVASRSPRTPGWANPHHLGADVAGEGANLKAEGGGAIQVPGSGGLTPTLLRSDLAGEFHLLVFPAIAGGGKRRFGDGALPRARSLTSIGTTAAGVVSQGDERTGDPKTGEFGPESEATDRSQR